MYSSKLKEKQRIKENIAFDVKKDLNEKKKLKIKIPKLKVHLNTFNNNEYHPKITHREIEINI